MTGTQNAAPSVLPAEVEPPAAGEAPSSPAATPQEQRAALPTNPAEGPDVSTDEYQALAAAYAALDDVTRERINSVLNDAAKCALPVHMKQQPSRRRWFIVKAQIALAQAEAASDDDLRTLVATVLDTEAAWFPSVSVGRCVGSLDVDAASQFHAIAQLHIAGLAVIETHPFQRFRTEG